MLKGVSFFWIGLLLIVALAGALRLLSYDFSLPYLDYPDEPAYYLGALEWRGQYNSGGYYAGIPPAYVAVHAAFRPILEAVGINNLGDTTRVLRLLSVAANLGTLVVIALAARLTAGDLAGLVAGAAWGVAPLVLATGVLALPDPLIHFCTALAVWLAIIAVLKPERSYYAVWSTVAGLLATLLKYPALPALLPGGLAALWLITRDRRQAVALLALQAALIAVTGVWLVFVYGVDFNNLQREGQVVQTEGFSNFFDLERAAHNIYFAAVPLNAAAFGVIAALGIMAYLAAVRRRLPRIHLTGAALALSVVIGIPWLAATFSLVQTNTIRYVLPATAAACVILGAALAQIAHLLPAKWARPGRAALVLPLVALVWWPQLQADWSLVQQRRLPDRRAELRQWFDTNLDAGTIIVGDENGKTFNPFWGGIPHRKWFDWWITDRLTDYSIEEWRQRGMTYAVIPTWQRDDLQRTPDGADYLAQLLHLRDFVPPPRQRGPDVVVYRLWRMAVETDVRFGDAVRLTGYDRSAERVKPGDTLALRFYWNAAQTPADNYSLFVHLVPADTSTVLAQADGAPAVPERPTLTWNEPSETLISPPFNLTLPPDLAPGQYRVMVGLYNFQTGARLPILDADGTPQGDALPLMTLDVES